MPVIDENNAAASQSSCEYWQDELKNARIQLYQLNLAIQTLESGTHQSYQIDTGQSSQRVTRFDIGTLYDKLENLTQRIRELELMPCNDNGSSGAVKQARPNW